MPIIDRTIVAGVPRVIQFDGVALGWAQEGETWYIGGPTTIQSSDPQGWTVEWYSNPGSYPSPGQVLIDAPAGTTGEFSVSIRYGGATYTPHTPNAVPPEASNQAVTVVCLGATISHGDPVPQPDHSPLYDLTFTVTPVGGEAPYSNDFDVDTPAPFEQSEPPDGLSITFGIPYDQTGTVTVTANLTDANGCTATVTTSLELTPVEPPDDCTLTVEADYEFTDATHALLRAQPSEAATVTFFVDGGYLETTPGTGTIETAVLEVPLGASKTVYISAAASGCLAYTSLLVVNPEGPGTTDCDLSVSLSYARVGPGQFRVTAVTTAPSVDFSFGTGGHIANETAKSCLVSVAPGTTINVRALVEVDDCSDFATIAVDGNSEGGGTVITADISLALTDEGGGSYLVVATFSGLKSPAPTLTWLVDGVVTPFSDGLTTHLRLTVPYGSFKTVTAALVDGTDVVVEALKVINGDGTGVIIPEPTISEDDCVARLAPRMRDFKCEASRTDAVIARARFGVEARSLCDNAACNYWVQLYYSSDPALFGVYTAEALAAHFPMAPEKGEAQTASGNRFARQQYVAGATMRPPHWHVHLREVWTPVYELWNLNTGTSAVVKIRDISETSALVFGTGPAKVFRYDAAPDTAVGPDRAGTLTLLAALADVDASDATDVCLIGDKIYVVAPGELFVVDTDAGQSVLNYGVRGETRAPVFVENVGGKPIAVYVDEDATPKTKAYDLSFQPPRPVWTMDDAVTKAEVFDGKLLVAAGADFYSSDAGTAAPALQHSFGADITAMAGDYVGLSDGHIWHKLSTGWDDANELAGPVGALWTWYGGADEIRALAGAQSGADANILQAEQTNTAWAADRGLEDASGELAMRSLTREITAMTETTPAVLDERMLIGDDNGQLWSYQISAISEKDGAFKTCHTTNQRITPQFRARVDSDT